MFLCKWWARKQISLHRDNKVVLYCIILSLSKHQYLFRDIVPRKLVWADLHLDSQIPGGWASDLQQVQRSQDHHHGMQASSISSCNSIHLTMDLTPTDSTICCQQHPLNNGFNPYWWWYYNLPSVASTRHWLNPYWYYNLLSVASTRHWL